VAPTRGAVTARGEARAAATRGAVAAARGVPGGGKRGSDAGARGCNGTRSTRRRQARQRGGEGGARNPGRLLLRVSFFSLFFWKRTTLSILILRTGEPPVTILGQDSDPHGRTLPSLEQDPLH